LSFIDVGGAAVGVQEVKMAQLVLDPKTKADPPPKDGRKEEREDAKERRQLRMEGRKEEGSACFLRQSLWCFYVTAYRT
jgi:hypothetical protein